jgi:tetratricopeptide (TPR) repeat protein
VTCPRCSAKAPAKARFCPACGQGLGPGPDEQSWANALLRFNRGDYAAAEAELQPLLLLPGDAGARALAWIGHANFFRGREADAESAYRRALDKANSLWEARYQLGALAFAQGRHAEAADAFALAARLAPRLQGSPVGGLFSHDDTRAQAQTQLYLGLSLRELGRIEEAEQALRASLKLNQGDPLAYGVLGDLLVAAGRFGEAAESYTQALAKVTDEQGLRSLRNDLGVAHFQAGALDKAAEAFKLVLKDKPDDANALHNLGMLYLKQGLGDELRQDLREFLKAEKAEQLLLGLTRSLVEGARGQAGQDQGDSGIIGRSQAVRDVLDLLRRAAGSDANVLLGASSQGPVCGGELRRLARDAFRERAFWL